MTEQLTEMTALIAELVELARGDQAPVEPEDVRLDLVTADAIERTRRNRPGVSFEPDLQESMIRGVPCDDRAGDLEPARQRGKVEPAGRRRSRSTVRDGELTVRDHGPGIDPDDLPFVFDRFYRAPPHAGCPARVSASRSPGRWPRPHGGSDHRRVGRTAAAP